jgi:pilus assembly protein CpaB
MQLRAIIMLALALVLGGITVFLVNTFLQQEVGQRGKVQEIRTVPVVVANADLKIGTRLEPMMLSVIDWPEAAAPEGAFNDVGVLLGEKPPVALQEMRRGEIVLPYKLSPHGARGGLPARIPEDMRAVTIPVSEITGVAGFIVPGDYVDVLHTSDVGRADRIPVTRVLLQNVQVLGIDQVATDEDSKPRVVNAVTLLVNTEAGQRLTLAMATGSINLLLRNEIDASLLAVEDVTWKDLQPMVQEPTKPKIVKRVRREAPVKPQVEVIRGLQVTNQTVPNEAAPAQQAPATQNP